MTNLAHILKARAVIWTRESMSNEIEVMRHRWLAWLS
ncbi:uncharacterized protein METZ01_LOCUS425735, partial [marine metagenome]